MFCLFLLYFGFDFNLSFPLSVAEDYFERCRVQSVSIEIAKKKFLEYSYQLTCDNLRERIRLYPATKLSAEHLLSVLPRLESFMPPYCIHEDATRKRSYLFGENFLKFLRAETGDSVDSVLGARVGLATVALARKSRTNPHTEPQPVGALNSTRKFLSGTKWPLAEPSPAFIDKVTKCMSRNPRGHAVRYKI